MKNCFIRLRLTKATLIVLAAASLLLVPSPGIADTSWVNGGNWADNRDNFQDGVIYPNGITVNTTAAQAAAVADKVADDDISLGINFERIGINPATITS